MSDQDETRAETRPPHLGSTIPYVWVKNVPEAIPYYRDVLGFSTVFTHDWEYGGETYGLAIMERDDAVLHVRVCECGDYRHTGTSFFQIEMEGVDALHQEFVEKGAIIRFPPTTQEWGVRDFQTEDPEGNRIYFFEHV